MMFGTRTVWRQGVQVALSDPARTLADLLDDPSLGGGMRHVAQITRAYFASEMRDDSALLGYLARMGHRTVYKRLGYLAEALSLDVPEVVAACLVGKSSGLTTLDPAVKSRGRLLKRWNLWVNVHLGPGEREP
jgi:predicted transcriptional regulator of viral defense system